jgi:signal transduction histidine kinase
MIGMEHLIDDLLFLARLDAPGRPVRDEIVDLDDLVFAETAALRAEAPGIVVDTAAVSAARVRGDANELARVVRNVLDNARRHAAGRVVISLTEAGEHAVLTVDDNGPGIPPQHRQEVFGRFVRLEDARTPGSGSSGLGLAIARDIVDRHGGTIAASESATGGGRVIVTLPRAD